MREQSKYDIADYPAVQRLITDALHEDMPFGDMTTDSMVDDMQRAVANVVAKQRGIVAGATVFGRVFQLLDADVRIHYEAQDGVLVADGDVVMRLEGKTAALLKGERVALNLFGRMSGIATKTRAYADQIANLHASVTDTRKTTPGLRLLEKYAVKMGGGSNHRFSLSDGVLIKENHIKVAGGIAQAIALAKKSAPHTVKIEVETETLEEVKQAIQSKADIIMLDNMDNETMEQAVKMIGGRARTEASGNVSLDGVRNIREIAQTGVDLISVGSLTHSVENFDFSMLIVG